MLFIYIFEYKLISFTNLKILSPVTFVNKSNIKSATCMYFISFEPFYLVLSHHSSNTAEIDWWWWAVGRTCRSHAQRTMGDRM